MPIQLDKILADIAGEKVLHPRYPDATKKELDEAWARVGKSNKLSVHEARSIFKVLQKKYEQEKVKGTSAWKLFKIMDEIHRKIELKPAKHDDSDLPMEEDEEYEMLEVQEEDEQGSLAHASNAQAMSAANNSEGESPDKSTRSNSSTETYERDDKNLKCVEEKKLLNTMASATPRPAPAGTAHTSTTATAATLQKKGITVKKTYTNAGNKPATAITANAKHAGKTIQLPEAVKRKLSEEQSANPPPTKKASMGQMLHTSVTQSSTKSSTAGAIAKTNSPKAHNTSSSSHNNSTSHADNVHVKQEPDDAEMNTSGTNTVTPHGINVITIPANPTRADIANSVGHTGPSSSTAATVASTSINGYSPRIEDIDFKNDIIFDAGNGINGTIANKVTNTNATDIINLGNFDNSLPPTFFKNLCNSSRHEALGLYVANVMNRLRTRSAAKLELAILRAIIDVQSDELEQ